MDGIRRIESRDGVERGSMVYVKSVRELCKIVDFHPDRSFDVDRQGWLYGCYLHDIGPAPTPGTEIRCTFVVKSIALDGTVTGTITEILRD